MTARETHKYATRGMQNVQESRDGSVAVEAQEANGFIYAREMRVLQTVVGSLDTAAFLLLPALTTRASEQSRRTNREKPC